MRFIAAITLLIATLATGCASKKTTETGTQPAATDKAATPTTSAKTADEAKVTCTSGKDVRTLEVKSVDPKGCDLIYTKMGEPKSVASSAYGLSHCQSISDRIQKNLETAGFKCQ